MNEKVPNIIWIDEPDGVYYTEPLDGSVEYHRALSPAEVSDERLRNQVDSILEADSEDELRDRIFGALMAAYRSGAPAEVEAKAGRAARLILNAPLEDSAPDDCDCSDHQRMREVAAIIAAEFGGEEK